MTRHRMRILLVAGLLLVVAAVIAANAGAAASGDVTVVATVVNSTDVPTLVSPGDGAVSGTLPTLSATFLDPENDTGTITFEVCSDPGCGIVLRTGTSTSGLASGTDGTWTVVPALATGAVYWRARATDGYLDESAWSAARQLLVNDDFDDPTAAPEIVKGVNPGYQHVIPGPIPRVWINPALGGSFTLQTNPADATSGVDRVDFPGAMTFDWTPYFPNSVSAPPFEQLYTWAPGSLELGMQNFVVWDDSPAANSSTGSFEVRADDTAPVGGSITVPDDTTNDPAVLIPFDVGLDTGSGVDLTRNRIWRATGTYADGTCTGVGSFVPVGIPGEATPFSDGDLASGECYQYELHVLDYVGNERVHSSANEVRVDHETPTGTISPTPAGPVNAGATFTGTITDAVSMPASVTISYDNGAGTSGEACPAFAPTGAGATRSWSCAWDATALPDGVYTIAMTGVDAAGNAMAAPETRTITLERVAPVFTSVTLTEQADPEFQHAVNCALPCTPRLYYDPARPGSVDVAVAGTDLGGGIASATFPDADGVLAWWTPAGGAVQAGAGPFVQQYARSGPDSTAPSPLWLQLTDTAGNTSTQPVELVPDTTAPSMGIPANPPDYRTVLSVPVSFTPGSDGAGSGIESSVVEREDGSLVDDACTMTGSWNPAPLVAGSDTDVVDGACYRYRIVTTDRVGHTSTGSVTSTVKVDTSPPTSTFDPLPASPWLGTITMTGDASDVATGVASVQVAYGGTATGIRCIAITELVWASSGCPIDTTTLPNGPYTFTATVTDRAGNQTSSSRSVVIDNAAPTVSIAGITELVGAPYQHSSGSTLWVNPTASGTARIVVNPVDPHSGVASVTFPPLGGGWAPASGGVVASPGPYVFDYAFTAPVTGAGTQTVTATDIAGHSGTTSVTVVLDGATPVGGSVTYADGVGAAPSVAFNVGSDASSGIGTWLLERRQAPMSSPTACDTGAWLPWGMVGVPDQTPPYVDTTVESARCYQYRLIVLDRVGNRAEYTHPSTFVTPTSQVPVAITTSTEAVSVAEPATSSSFDVRLAAQPVGSVTVSLSASTTQARVSPAALTFDASNWSAAQTATVTAVDDPDVDGAAQLQVSVQGSSTTDPRYAGLAGAPVGVTVADDDVAAVLVDASTVSRVSERTPDQATTMTVRLGARPAADVRVAPTTADGELRVPTGLLTFTRESWSTAQSVRVVAFDDPVAETTPHHGRVVFKTTSDDAAFQSIADQPVNVEIDDDDPARFLQRPGSGWTPDASGAINLREDGSGAVVSIVADGDPTRAIRIEPIVSSEADVTVTPAVATISPDAPNAARSFTVSAVDDGANEDATESVRLTWKVTTVDPLYHGKRIASTSLKVIDKASAPTPTPTPTPNQNDPTPTPNPNPAPNDPSPPPTPTSDGGGTPDPGGPGPGTTVGDDSKTTGATGATRTPSRRAPRSHDDGGITKFAKKHPVATSGIASVAIAAGATLAKPLLIGGKLIGSLGPGAGGGMGHLHGLGQLRHLIRRKRRGVLGRLLAFLRRRARRDTEEDDPLTKLSGVEHDAWRRLSRDWRDLLDPDRNNH